MPPVPLLDVPWQPTLDWSRAAAVALHSSRGRATDDRFVTEARVAATDNGLAVRWHGRFDRLISAPEDTPVDAAGATPLLWTLSDVGEIFGGPEAEAGRYAEVQLAPDGRWVALDIDLNRDESPPYRSALHQPTVLESAVGAGSWAAALMVPWAAFGRRPESGETWAGNLYRLIPGPAPDDPPRTLLAWSPTGDSFHRPERFGRWRF